jgi:hypothetical protein
VRRVIDILGHRLWGRVALAVIAGLVILPNLGGPGLWEPQELAVADRAVTRADKAAKGAKAAPDPADAPGRPKRRGAGPAKAAEPDDLVDPAATSPASSQARQPPRTGGAAPSAATAPTAEADPDEPAADPTQTIGPCSKTAPTDDGARTLTERLLARDTTDRGMRWPLALLGLLVVAGVAGIGFRLGSTRAGVLAGLVCLSFPLLGLQARMLTSEIGTPAGGVLIVYGLLFSLRTLPGLWRIVDAITSAGAVALGCWLAFAGGGVLLGVVVPVGAIAIAGGLGWPAVRELFRIAGPATDAAIARLARAPRSLIPRARRPGLGGEAWTTALIALAATLAVITLFVVLAVQLYDLRDPIPGTRALWGKSIVPSECWSTALGGLWKFDDFTDARYDIAFEQIAFGTFPWGIAAPVAVGALLASARPEHRRAGAIALVWGAGAWLATIAFQRKVGFTIYAGFPAIALAVGIWLDAVIDEILAGRDRAPDPSIINIVAILFIVLGIVTLFKDLQTFPERLTSLLVGKDAIKYPKHATLLALPLRTWVLVLGGALALSVGLGLGLSTASHRVRVRAARWIRVCVVAMLVLTVVIAAFWTHGWQTRLARVLSSKSVFADYRDRAKDGDVLGIVGDMGNAPRYYAGGPWEKVPSRDGVLAFLQRADGKRAFVLMPGNDLCALHKAAAGKPYYVLDDTNARTLLLSNQLDPGASNKNPLAKMVLRAEPTADIQIRPSGRIVFDNKIELIGWNLPAKVGKGDEFTMTLFFHVLESVGSSWKIFAHFDPAGGAARFQGDHAPMNDRCQTSYWQKGDFIVDTVRVEAGDVGSATGDYQAWIGFFIGSSGTYKNMKVTAAPPGSKDDVDRVRIGSITVR